jgi:type IV pilus assembly protein PilA
MKENSSGITALQLILGLFAAAVLAVLIVSTIVIPTLLKIKIQNNEQSAITSLHAIAESQLEFQRAHSEDGFACSLQTLEGGPSLTHGPDGDQKDGYTFNIGNCTKVTVNAHDTYTAYQVTAVPQTVGKTGNRGFCIDEQNGIKADPAGGVNCTDAVQ